MLLSKRGREWASHSSDLTIWQVLKDLWHPEQNPDGFVSLGVAENSLMHSEMTAYINSNVRIENAALTYGDGGSGSKALRIAMAKFLTRKLKPVVPIESSHICITNGVSCSIEHLCSVLGDEGDVVILGQPHYGAFIDDIELRPGTKVAQVAFGTVDPLSIEAVSAYERQIQKSTANGQKVVALILCNPHNPLGRCYSKEFLVDLMKLCEKYQVHFISDEIYALSVFRDSGAEAEKVVPFTSLASIPTEGLINPGLTHVLHGLSKDFGANGLRLGCIISQHNPSLHEALIPVAIYSYASSLVEVFATKLLMDDAFVDSYISENCRRLEKNYTLVRSWADGHKITYTKGTNAAFFLWTDLGTVFQNSQATGLISEDVNSNGNKQISDALKLNADIQAALLKNKVFLASGTSFGSELPGWFRIVFSQDEKNLREGLSRIERTLGLDNESVHLSTVRV